MRKQIFHIFLFSYLILSSELLYAQISFGDFSSLYTATLAELSPAEELEFGLLIKGETNLEIGIGDAKVFSIEGVRYLDIIVDISAETNPPQLLLDGLLGNAGDAIRSFEYTLNASYANNGIESTSNVRDFSFMGMSGSAQFPIRYRGNAPPGPPPTPVYEGYDPSVFNETAYLYIYASIPSVPANLISGSYSTSIDVTIYYD